MNLLLPDKFVRIDGTGVKLVVYDIAPLREDYGVTPILLSVLRDLARGTGIVVEHCDELLNEVSLTDKRIEDALVKTDADLLVFGSYVATRSNVQLMIHIICTYGRPMEHSTGLPEGMDLNQAIQEGDAIVQMPRHVLVRDVLSLTSLETLSLPNDLAEEIFYIASFIQAVKLYKEGKFDETAQVVSAILSSLGAPDDWPAYWAPYNYLHMLAGLAYLRAGNTQAAMYTLSNAIARSTPDKMRVQRCAEQILSSLLQPEEIAPEEGATETSAPETGAAEPAKAEGEPKPA